MVRQMCDNSTGELQSGGFTKPLPYVGLYVAAASCVCLLLMSIDIATSFRLKTRWVRCKLFKLNAVSLTLLSVATKLPVDLNTSMPGPIHQLTKLSGTVMLCTAMAFTMPSLGAMEDEEILSNVVALALLVVTVVVNICIQIGTGAILPTLWPEHIINTAILQLSLLILCSSSPYIKIIRQRIFQEVSRLREACATEHAEILRYDLTEQKLENCKKSLHKTWLVTCTGNPQFAVSASSQCCSVGCLSILSGVLLLEAEARSLLLPFLSRGEGRKGGDFCKGGSDYAWSIPVILISQSLFVLASIFVISVRVYHALAFRDLGMSIAALLCCHYGTREYMIVSRRIEWWGYSSWEIRAVDFGLPKWLTAIVMRTWNLMVVLFDTLIYKAGWWASGWMVSTLLLFYSFILGLATCFSKEIGGDTIHEPDAEIDGEEEDISGFAVAICPFSYYNFNEFKRNAYARAMAVRVPKVINAWISRGEGFANHKPNVDFINFISSKVTTDVESTTPVINIASEEGRIRDGLFVFFQGCINTVGMDFFLAVLANLNKWVFSRYDAHTLGPCEQDAKKFSELVFHARRLALFVDKHAFGKGEGAPHLQLQDVGLTARDAWYCLEERSPPCPQERTPSACVQVTDGATAIWNTVVHVIKSVWPKRKKESPQITDSGRLDEYDYECPELLSQLPNNSESVRTLLEKQILDWFWESSAQALAYGLSSVVDKMHTLGQAKMDLEEEDVREAASILGMLQGFNRLFPDTLHCNTAYR